jgi:hypothetical protein
MLEHHCPLLLKRVPVKMGTGKATGKY